MHVLRGSWCVSVSVGNSFLVGQKMGESPVTSIHEGGG